MIPVPGIQTVFYLANILHYEDSNIHDCSSKLRSASPSHCVSLHGAQSHKGLVPNSEVRMKMFGRVFYSAHLHCQLAPSLSVSLSVGLRVLVCLCVCLPIGLLKHILSFASCSIPGPCIGTSACNKVSDVKVLAREMDLVWH